MRHPLAPPAIFTRRGFSWWALCFGALAMMPGVARAAESSPAAPPDYEFPRLLTGTIYAPGPLPRRALFSFRRTATRIGPRVDVLREYRLPDGTLAARERVVYQDADLISFELADLRSGDRGRAVRQRGARGGNDRLRLEFAAGGMKATVDEERLQPDTLVNDMIPPFINTHWADLMAGKHLKFRFAALSRTETVGFQLIRDADTMREGRSVVRLRMEPTSIVIARLVEPLFFLVEKGGAHRILEYTGRTTPRVNVGHKWKDLDAVTVFAWD